MALERAEQKQEIDRLSHSTSGLSTSGCTLESGGYTKLSNIVIVNMRIKLTSAVSGAFYPVSGLPSPLGSINNVALTTNNRSIEGFINGGVIQLNASANMPSNTVIFVSGIYLTSE